MVVFLCFFVFLEWKGRGWGGCVIVTLIFVYIDVLCMTCFCRNK